MDKVLPNVAPRPCAGSRIAGIQGGMGYWWTIGMIVSAQRGRPPATETERDARWSRSAGRGAVPVVLVTNDGEAATAGLARHRLGHVVGRRAMEPEPQVRAQERSEHVGLIGQRPITANLSRQGKVRYVGGQAQTRRSFPDLKPSSPRYPSRSYTGLKGDLQCRHPASLCADSNMPHGSRVLQRTRPQAHPVNLQQYFEISRKGAILLCLEVRH